MPFRQLDALGGGPTCVSLGAGKSRDKTPRRHPTGIFPAPAARPLRLLSTSEVERLSLVSLEIPDVGSEFREGYSESHNKPQNNVFGDTCEEIQIRLNDWIAVVIQKRS